MTKTDPGIRTGRAGFTDRFLERLGGGKSRSRWLAPSRHRPLAAAASQKRFASNILARVESPGILHRNLAINGRRLFPSRALANLEIVLPEFISPPTRMSSFRDRASVPDIDFGEPTRAEIRTGVEGRLGPTVSRPSAIGRLNRSLLEASQPLPLDASTAVPPARAGVEGRLGSTVSRPSAIGRLNRSLLEASQPLPLDASTAVPPARPGSSPPAVGQAASHEISATEAGASPSQRGAETASQTVSRRQHPVQLSTANPTITRSPVGVQSQLLAQARQSSPRVLNESRRAPLESYLELEAGRAMFYDNPPADELNRRLGSDALSVGQEVFFRQGRFAPDDPRGLALLGHELTHVDASRADALRQRPPMPTSPAEERLAVANEMRVLHEVGISVRPVPLAPSNPVPVVATAVRTASGQRFGEYGDDAPTESEGLSDRQLAELRESLYHDLRERLRIDHERGA